MFGILNAQIKYCPENNEQEQPEHNFFTPRIVRIQEKT